MGFDRALFKRLMAELPRENLKRLARDRPPYAIVNLGVKVSAAEKLGLLDLVSQDEDETMSMSRYMRNLLRDRLGLGPIVYPEYDEEEMEAVIATL